VREKEAAFPTSENTQMRRHNQGSADVGVEAWRGMLRERMTSGETVARMREMRRVTSDVMALVKVGGGGEDERGGGGDDERDGGGEDR